MDRVLPAESGLRRAAQAEIMTTRKSIAIAILAATAASAIAIQVRAGGDKVAFPANFASGVTYTTLDRADNKQYRE
jgi:hypothetical protein